jgi:hypothetical protein
MSCSTMVLKTSGCFLFKWVLMEEVEPSEQATSSGPGYKTFILRHLRLLQK